MLFSLFVIVEYGNVFLMCVVQFHLFPSLSVPISERIKHISNGKTHTNNINNNKTNTA